MVEKTRGLVARSLRGFAFLAAVVCLPLHAATINVPADFPTIQAGIDAAASGDTIQVAAGTYTEQIVISKSLTLTGAGSATTIIQAPATTTPDPIIGAGSIVVVNNAATVSMSGFTVQGPGQSLCSVSYGVAVYGNAVLTFDNNHVTHIRDLTVNNQGGCGMAIRAGFPSQTASLIVSNTQVDDYQKNGIVVDSGSTGTISNSTMTELSPQTVIAQNGIVIRAGATATITGNTISGHQYDGPGSGGLGIDPINSTQAAGIVTFGSATMSGNNINNNDIGIGSSTSFSTSSGDIVSGNRYEDILGLAGTLSLAADSIGGTSVYAIAAIAFSGDTADATVLVDCLSSITGQQQALVESGATTKSSIVVGTCGIKTAAGQLTPGSDVTYTIVLNNGGTVDLADTSGDEFTDVLPAALTLVSATSDSGTALATIGTNTVTWNGAIAAGASVTITITATLSAAATPGTTVSNQGTIHTDLNGTPTDRTTGATAGEEGSTDFIVATPTPVRLQSFDVE